ncbi:hypothetical protein [Burkholderia gladioli]|uniref:hypothetical protein n=1 Tax=Burkholderia gladioli TaxID=28095 RepID=UPI0016404FE4|nr:hypothetical protein [Burkholderia gladioli]
MRLLVRMLLPISLAAKSREAFEVFECVAQWIRGPARGTGTDAVIDVDIFLPDQYLPFASPFRWNRDGTYRVQARVFDNRRTLGDFLECGERERYVGDQG